MPNTAIRTHAAARAMNRHPRKTEPRRLRSGSVVSGNTRGWSRWRNLASAVSSSWISGSGSPERPKGNRYSSRLPLAHCVFPTSDPTRPSSSRRELTSRAVGAPTHLLAQLLHAAMQVDSNGTWSQSCVSGNLRTGHAFDQAEDQRFAIGVRQSADELQDLLGAYFGRVAHPRGLGCAHREHLFDRGRRLEATAMVIGAATCDCSQPASETRGVVQVVKSSKRVQENILNKVVHVGKRNASKQNAVHHSRVTRVQTAERIAVAVARSGNQSGIIRAFGHVPTCHGPTLHHCAAEVNSGLHDDRRAKPASVNTLNEDRQRAREGVDG